MVDAKRRALWCAVAGGVLVVAAAVLGVVNMLVLDASVPVAVAANVLIGLGGLLLVAAVVIALVASVGAKDRV